MLKPKDCFQLEIDLSDSESDYLGTIDSGVFEDMFTVAGILANTTKEITVQDIIRDICPDNMVGIGAIYFPTISVKIAKAYATAKLIERSITQISPNVLQ